jgi:hypothetical protein
MFSSASRTESSKPSNPCGGVGTHLAISRSRATTSVTSERTSGLAIAPGTGVMRLIQWLDSDGLSTGTGTMIRRRRPATPA